MASILKSTKVKAWTEEFSPALSENALVAAKEHLTFEEARERGFLDEGDSQGNYTAAREKHIEITLAYIKGKPKSLMKR
ncbi:MAG: hypothetical protein LBE35_03330 [Clostridiales bacterium]|jgi:hypothetical protein|nr:hypothetical protein [Clostridiales bacterium]